MRCSICVTAPLLFFPPPPQFSSGMRSSSVSDLTGGPTSHDYLCYYVSDLFYLYFHQCWQVLTCRSFVHYGRNPSLPPLLNSNFNIRMLSPTSLSIHPSNFKTTRHLGKQVNAYDSVKCCLLLHCVKC